MDEIGNQESCFNYTKIYSPLVGELLIMTCLVSEHVKNKDVSDSSSSSISELIVSIEETAIKGIEK